MLRGEHSAILSTFIKLPFVIKIFVLYIIEWPFYAVFTLNDLLDVHIFVRIPGKLILAGLINYKLFK